MIRYVIRTKAGNAYWTSKGLSPNVNNARLYKTRAMAQAVIARLKAEADFVTASIDI